MRGVLIVNLGGLLVSLDALLVFGCFTRRILMIYS
ncbi:hypothetical protein ABIE66_004321 [Peribacillus sp. B2I2]